MAMCRALEKHGFLLVKKEEELYEIVDAAMSIAAWRNPKEFRRRRDGIAKNLFSLPEDVIGSCYEKSHCTEENATGSALTKDSVPQGLSTVIGDNSPKKNPKKIKHRIKPYKPTSTNSKQDEKKVDEKSLVSKIVQHKKKYDDHGCGVSMANPSSKSIASNVKSEGRNIDGALLNEKLKATKRKLEERYKQLGDGERKTKLLDFAEMKDLIKPSRCVKRPRFRR